MDFKERIKSIVYSHRNHPEPERHYLIGRDIDILLSRPAKQGRGRSPLHREMKLLNTIELLRRNLSLANLRHGETVEDRAALMCEGKSGPNMTKIVQRRMKKLKERLST